MRKWAFAIVPAFGLWELGAHVVQVGSVVPLDDWNKARDVVDAQWKPGDLVVFAPEWADPVGREAFGEKLAGIANEGRGDDTGYARAFEVSIRGSHASELDGWKKVGAQKVGGVTVTTLENPSPAHVLDSLLAHANPGPTGMRVTRVDASGENDCRWQHAQATGGGLGSGPPTPGDRFVCQGGSFVGVTVLFDYGMRARRCFYAPPAGNGATVRMHFQDVAFGGAVHGHCDLQYEAERNLDGAPVTLTFRANDRVLGKITHADGDGWKQFELSTSDLQRTRGELVVDVDSRQAGRQFCFEADTR